VRAIDSQTEPIGPRLREVNQALEQVASALDSAGRDVRADGGSVPARPGPEARW
jgi:hypothetical protein